jgi:hypothetical protein
MAGGPMEWIGCLRPLHDHPHQQGGGIRRRSIVVYSLKLFSDVTKILH